MKSNSDNSVSIPITKPKTHAPSRWVWLTICFLAVLIAAPDVRAAISSTPTSWPGGRWYPDTPTYGVAVERDVPIVMDDGITLYANVAYPTNSATGERAPGPFPVILTQNPYDFPSSEPDPRFVSRGYIHAVADQRGTQRSQLPAGLIGDFLGPRMGRDGVNLTHWAAQLPRANGVVGLSGCSALGIIQLQTAALIGPNSPIKAIVPACASNGYETYLPGGIASPVVQLFPYTANPAAAAWGYAFLTEILSGGPRAYNGTFWQERDTSLLAPQVVHNGIPALLWSGWAALEVTGAMDLYSIFQNTATQRPPFGLMHLGQPVSSRYQIVVGPGGHGVGLDRFIELEWFDHWLKGQATGIDKVKTPMHLYELGSNRWINTARLPVVPISTPFFLVAPGKLSNFVPFQPGSETLSWKLPSEAGGKLVYDAAPFKRDLTIAGPVAASIWASSSNTNLQLIATLFDVAPNGTATEVTFGGLIGSLRALDNEQTWRDLLGQVIKPEHPFTADSYLVPGKVQRFDLKLTPRLYSIPAGHSLRLTITAKNDPATQCNLLLGLTQARQCVYSAPQLATLPGGQYVVQRGLKTPSVITVPLIESDHLHTAWSDYTVTSPTQTQALDWGPTRH